MSDFDFDGRSDGNWLSVSMVSCNGPGGLEGERLWCREIIKSSRVARRKRGDRNAYLS